jgi:hypothetical protein
MREAEARKTLVGIGELRARNLPPQDRQLMAEHDDLEILGTPETTTLGWWVVSRRVKPRAA